MVDPVEACSTPTVAEGNPLQLETNIFCYVTTTIAAEDHTKAEDHEADSARAHVAELGLQLLQLVRSIHGVLQINREGW